MKANQKHASHPCSNSGFSKGGEAGLLSRLTSKLADASLSSDDGESSSDEEEFVASVHKGVNEARKKHGVAKLRLNKEVRG